MRNIRLDILVIIALVSAGLGAFITRDANNFGESSALADPHLTKVVERLNNHLERLEKNIALLVDSMNRRVDSPVFDASLQNKLLQTVTLAVQEAISTDHILHSLQTEVINDPTNILTSPESRTPEQRAAAESPKMVIVNPTHEQNQIFENLKRRLNDPVFLSSLSFAELIQMEEMKTIPEPLQQVILSRAIAKFNNGEIDEQTFLHGTPTAPDW